MSRVRVQYFAVLREEAGRSEEMVDTAAGTLADLYEELRSQHRFGLSRERLKVVANEDFVDWTRPVREGDTIVFIPPIAGG